MSSRRVPHPDALGDRWQALDSLVWYTFLAGGQSQASGFEQRFAPALMEALPRVVMQQPEPFQRLLGHPSLYVAELIRQTPEFHRRGILETLEALDDDDWFVIGEHLRFALAWLGDGRAGLRRYLARVFVGGTHGRAGGWQTTLLALLDYRLRPAALPPDELAAAIAAALKTRDLVVTSWSGGVQLVHLLAPVGAPAARVPLARAAAAPADAAGWARLLAVG